MYMRADPMFWIVPASVAMAVGTTIIFLTILHHNLILQIVDTNTILLSGTGGIALGIIGLAIGYYYFQMKPLKITDRILIEVKVRNATEVKQREDRKKKYYLHYISCSVLQIIKNLIRLANLVDKYNNDPPPKDWQIVRYSADRSRKQTEELGKKIILDFTQIIDLVENPRLADKFRANNLYYAEYLIDKTLRIDPEYDKELLRELRKEIREQIGKLDGILSLLEEEEKTSTDEK